MKSLPTFLQTAGDYEPSIVTGILVMADRIIRRMMTSSNGNIVRVTRPLREEFTGHRWIPLTKTSDAEL